MLVFAPVINEGFLSYMIISLFGFIQFEYYWYNLLRVLQILTPISSFYNESASTLVSVAEVRREWQFNESNLRKTLNYSGGENFGFARQ